MLMLVCNLAGGKRTGSVSLAEKQRSNDAPAFVRLVKPMPRRTATRFSQCGFINMRASGDGSDEPVLIASTGRADDDLSARLAFDELATRKVDRLFSNIEQDPESKTFKRRQISLLGATALVGGTTVGAGVLALPAATLQAGALPSSLVLIAVWIYMCCTGLLIAEVNVNVMCREGQPGLGLLALAERTLVDQMVRNNDNGSSHIPTQQFALWLQNLVTHTLAVFYVVHCMHAGSTGARIAGVLYAFIHYALLVAYMAQGGGLLQQLIHSVQGGAEGSLAWEGPVVFTTILGGAMAFGSSKTVENVNNSLVVVVLVSYRTVLCLGSIFKNIYSYYMTSVNIAITITVVQSQQYLMNVALYITTMMIISRYCAMTVVAASAAHYCSQLHYFALLLGIGASGIQGELLAHQDWTVVAKAAPVMLVALVFHNVVPVITTQLEGNVAKIRLVGSELYHCHHATHMLTTFAVPCTHYFYTILCTNRTAIIGGSAVPLLMFLAWNTVVLGSVDSAVVASATSSSGTFDPVQSLQGVGDYAAQLPQIVSVFSEGELPLYLLILGPPLVLAIIEPTIFFNALESAGTFGISLLFGLLPAAMAWQQRYVYTTDFAFIQ
eukprot:1763-Heterococcus_DN1.PRE.7